MSLWKTKEGSSGRLIQLCIGYFVFYVITGVTVKYFLGKPEQSFDEACTDRIRYLEQYSGFLNVAVDVYRARTHSIRPV